MEFNDEPGYWLFATPNWVTVLVGVVCASSLVMLAVEALKWLGAI